MLHRRTLPGTLVVLWACVSTFVAAPTKAEERDEPRLPMRIPVLVIKYFPVRGDLIDVEVTGDCGAPLEEMRQKTMSMTQELLSCTPARISLPRLQEPEGCLPAWFTRWRERTSSWSHSRPLPVLARKSR